MMIDEGRRGSSPTYFVTLALWYIISHMFSQPPNPTSVTQKRHLYLDKKEKPYYVYV